MARLGQPVDVVRALCTSVLYDELPETAFWGQLIAQRDETR
jgi:hypothetical protein